ncbi:beta-ketoacyl synthase chain length factor [Vibrio gallaecicus]|uniref:Beta-ketoacyl synthase chain length factor n=1 Tax=Vibrio gallaecicus TaxID=552386 RepID=A0ABV4N8K4_9VIBR
MSNPSKIMSFNIEKWAAHAPGLNTKEEWQCWATNINSLCNDENSSNSDESNQSKSITEFKAIPAMMRRRMSVQSKLAVQTALSLLQAQPSTDTDDNSSNTNGIDYLIFASRHGELHRTVGLIQSILEGEDASPMAFSQSVHNTAAGLTTIAAKAPIPLTSIASGQDTFHNALIEAAIYLHEKPNHKVLVVDFDQPLPTIYSEFEDQEFSDYALGLILSSGEQYHLSRSANHQTSVSNSDTHNASVNQQPKPQGIQALKNILSSNDTWNVTGKNQTWHWVKNS